MNSRCRRREISSHFVQQWRDNRFCRVPIMAATRPMQHDQSPAGCGPAMLRVAVVGGGAAGLAACRELLQEGIACTVYEQVRAQVILSCMQACPEAARCEARGDQVLQLYDGTSRFCLTPHCDLPAALLRATTLAVCGTSPMKSSPTCSAAIRSGRRSTGGQCMICDPMNAVFAVSSCHPSERGKKIHVLSSLFPRLQHIFLVAHEPPQGAHGLLRLPFRRVILWGECMSADWP